MSEYVKIKYRVKQTIVDNGPVSGGQTGQMVKRSADQLSGALAEMESALTGAQHVAEQAAEQSRELNPLEKIDAKIKAIDDFIEYVQECMRAVEERKSQQGDAGNDKLDGNSNDGSFIVGGAGSDTILGRLNEPDFVGEGLEFTDSKPLGTELDLNQFLKIRSDVKEFLPIIKLALDELNAKTTLGQKAVERYFFTQDVLYVLIRLKQAYEYLRRINRGTFGSVDKLKDITDGEVDKKDLKREFRKRNFKQSELDSYLGKPIDTIGYHYQYGTERRIIYLFWEVYTSDTESKTDKQNTILHEILHRETNLDHQERRNKWGALDPKAPLVDPAYSEKRALELNKFDAAYNNPSSFVHMVRWIEEMKGSQ